MDIQHSLKIIKKESNYLDSPWRALSSKLGIWGWFEDGSPPRRPLHHFKYPLGIESRRCRCHKVPFQTKFQPAWFCASVILLHICNVMLGLNWVDTGAPGPRKGHYHQCYPSPRCETKSLIKGYGKVHQNKQTKILQQKSCQQGSKINLWKREISYLLRVRVFILRCPWKTITLK